MASQVFPQTVEVEELLAAGRRQGVTQHGEMFSTKALARLAEETVTGVQAEVRRDVLSSPATLLQLLLQGDLVLVPYPFKLSICSIQGRGAGVQDISLR